MNMLTLKELTQEPGAPTGYDTVIVAAPDVQGRLFGRRIPLRQFRTNPRASVATCRCALAWDIAERLDVPVPWAGWHTGWNDFEIAPDLTTLRRYPGAARTAICLADSCDTTGEPVQIAPRTIMQRQVGKLAERGFTAMFASELEFYLFHQDQRSARLGRFQGLEPTTLVRSDYSIVGQATQEPFLARVRAAMEEAGIPIFACQAEYGLGQWEINLEYADPIEMADRHVIYKAGLKEMALAEGLSVTFMARPFSHDVGSSCHIHVSLWHEGRNVLVGEEDGSLSDFGRNFLGGLLAHLGDVALFYAPYVNSYKRHGRDEGGGVIGWGYDNRTVAVRVTGSGPSLRFEIRYPGADVNPYLAYSAAIASGLDGLDRRLDPGEPVKGNGSEVARLIRTSSSLGDAVRQFEESDFVCRCFGEDVRTHYATLCRAEWKEYLETVTDWELLRAFEIA
jgi:glutamine synthetase